MGLLQKLRRIKNQLFYGRDISLLDARGTAIPSPDPTIQLNIDGENSDLSNDPFYGDAALKRRKE